jgi:hypothetical protein
MNFVFLRRNKFPFAELKNKITFCKTPKYNYSMNISCNNSNYIYNTPSLFYKFNSFNFAAKKGGAGGGGGGGKKDDKKVKKEKEKEQINKEYESVSVDEVKSQYKLKSDNILKTLKEELTEIKVQRSNPKILDNLHVTILIYPI